MVGKTAAQKSGLRYEDRLQGFLSAQFPNRYVPSPWINFQYMSEDHTRWCQPDGLLFDFRRGIITIVEAKLNHTAEAFTQLLYYAEVLRMMFPEHLWNFSLCEVTRRFDCAVTCKVRPSLYASVAQVPPACFGVVIWKPE